MAMNDSQKKRLENVWEALKHDKIAIFSIAFLAIILILSLLAPVLPLEPNKTDVSHMLEAPSSVHIFGTDELGRGLIYPCNVRSKSFSLGWWLCRNLFLCFGNNYRTLCKLFQSA